MKKLELSKYVACICEGSAEIAIMDILLDHNLLIFQREDLLEETPLLCRNGKIFEETYLRRQFDDKITVVRVLDSRRENFKLSRAYQSKIDVVNVITAPEIELLIILNENAEKTFRKSKKKPSDFCKTDLKMPDMKAYSFVSDYFSDHQKLINAIKRYSEITKDRKDEYMLRDLLKE